MFLWLGSAAPASASGYTLSDVVFPVSLGVNYPSLAYGINNAGQISGYYWGAPTSLIDIAGVFTVYDNTGIGARRTGINNSGEMVGTLDGTNNGFTYQNGVATIISDPAAVGTMPVGINDSAKIVGNYFDANCAQHGSIELAGHFTTLDIPGATMTTVTGINDAGQIVGYYNNSTGDHGFVDSNGSIATINFPGVGGTSTDVEGINGAGQLVGCHWDTTGTGIHGFVDVNGSLTVLNDPKGANGATSYT